LLWTSGGHTRAVVYMSASAALLAVRSKCPRKRLPGQMVPAAKRTSWWAGRQPAPAVQLAAQAPLEVASPPAPWYEVCDVGSKGQGVLARAHIAKGEELVAERPLVIFEGDALEVMFDVSDDELLADVGLFREWERSFSESLRVHEPEDQRRFWELADTSEMSADGKKTAVGIARTNAIYFSDESAGIFLRVSRFNHSCNPNVYAFWREEDGMEVLRANRDLEEGEELCISYLSHLELCRPGPARRGRLRRAFGFRCLCSVCSRVSEARARSDQNRERLKQLNRDMQRARDLQGMGMAAVDELLELLDEEFDASPPARALACFAAFRLALASGHEDTARHMAQCAWESAVVSRGPDSWLALQLQELVEDPQSFNASDLRDGDSDAGGTDGNAGTGTTDEAGGPVGVDGVDGAGGAESGVM